MDNPDMEFDAPYPAELSRIAPGPRTVGLNRRARFTRAVLVCALLFAPNGILAFGWIMGEDLRDLEERGKPVLGRVTEKASASRRGGATYQIGYTYEVNGREFHNRRPVSIADYNAVERESSYLVTHLPDRPETHTPGRPGPALEQHNEASIRFALVASAILAVLCVGFEFALRRERLLARDGEPAIGKVTERGTTKTRNRLLRWVRHEFISPAQETVTDWHYVPEALWDKLRPGLRITLLYDLANPKRHLPLYAFEYAYIIEFTDDDMSSSSVDPTEIEQVSDPD
jgi:hypothetical protein